MADGDLDIGIRKVLIGIWDELLSRHFLQQAQHLGVEDFPGSDLLLDHIETGLCHAVCHHLESPVHRTGWAKKST